LNGVAVHSKEQQTAASATIWWLHRSQACGQRTNWNYVFFGEQLPSNFSDFSLYSASVRYRQCEPEHAAQASHLLRALHY
jgi:hypothetical protein